MPTLRLSVAVFTLAAVGAALVLLCGARRRDGLLQSAAKERRSVAGGARGDDHADLLARSQDMVSEGGPAGAQPGQGQ
jgi:hypothetical protein